jgi:hypothetical protein
MALCRLVCSADDECMTGTRGNDLHTAIWTLHAAVQRQDGIELRLRRGELDAELRDRSLTAAEAVVQARVALYRLLMSDGWVPPPAVAQDIEYDDTVLREASTEVLIAI